MGEKTERFVRRSEIRRSNLIQDNTCERTMPHHVSVITMDGITDFGSNLNQTQPQWHRTL